MPDRSASKVGRNTIVGTAGRLLTMVLGFAVTPTLLKSLGAEAFGVFAVVTSLQAYFGVLDLGIGGGLSRFMTYHQEREEWRLVRCITAFGILFYLLLAVILAPIVVAVAPTVVSWLGVKGQLAATSVNALYVVFGLFIGSSLSGIISARVYSAHRMDLTTMAGVIANVVYVVAVIYLVPRYPSIYTALTCSVIQVSVSSALNFLFMFKVSPGFVSNPLSVPLTLIRQLFSFGLWTQINSISAVVNLEADKLVIGRFLGVADVAPYQIANRLALLSRALPLQLLGALFPDITARLARGAKPEDVEEIYRSSLRTLMLSTLFIVGFLVAVSRKFIAAWIGADIPVAAFLAEALMISYAVNNLTGIGTTILRARGQPKFETIYAVFSAALNVGATILLIPHYGLYGVVGGTIIGNVIGSFLFMAIFHRLERFSVTKNVLSWLIPLVICVAFASVCTRLIDNLIDPNGLNRWISLGIIALSGAFYAILLAAALRVARFWKSNDFIALQRLGVGGKLIATCLVYDRPRRNV